MAIYTTRRVASPAAADLRAKYTKSSSREEEEDFLKHEDDCRLVSTTHTLFLLKETKCILILPLYVSIVNNLRLFLPL